MFEFQPITTLDFILTPLFFGLIYAFAKKYRDRIYPKGHPIRNYFLPALILKMFGAIIISIIYVYYYKYGDTINYFFHARFINSSLNESLEKWFNMVFAIADLDDPEYYQYISQMRWYGNSSSYAVPQIASIFGLFTFNTFIPTAILFATLSFIGVWVLFITFSDMYPKLIKPISTSILFIPSVILWGSGIFKDTICIFGLGLLTYTTFQFFIKRNWGLKNIFLFIFSTLIIAYVKIYILISFIPALTGWVLFSRTKKIKNRYLALLINISTIMIAILAFAVFFNQNSTLLGEYSIDKFEKTSAITRNYISYVSELENGSGYDLGEFTSSPLGMFSKFPQAVNVTLFRPYLWESRKFIVFLNALESLIILLITVRVLLSTGIKKTIYSLTSDYTIQFTFIFAIIFAFFVGISTYNFGTLSRYKIPCIPFYLLALVLIYYQNAKPGNRLWKFLGL